MLLVAMALLSAGCSVIKPDPVLAGEGVKYRPFGRVASVEVIAVSKAGRKQVDVLCHDDPGTNIYHPSAFRINLILARLDEMLAAEPTAPGSSNRVGEVTMPVFGVDGVPKMTFGTTTPEHPEAPPFYEVDCYDAFVDQTQHHDLTRGETEQLRDLFARAHLWLKGE